MTMALQQYESEWARTKIDWFALRFGKACRQLASYAALPLVLTPDLLHYLRTNFLRDEVPYVAEVDLLLSNLCEQVGYEQYMMDSAVRAYLIAEMRQMPSGGARMERVAHALISYAHQHAQTEPALNTEELQAQQWAALAYLEEKRHTVVRDLVLELRACIKPERANTDASALMRLSGIVEMLEHELSGYEPLIEYARQVRRILTEVTPDIPREQLDSQVKVPGIDLDLPPLANLLSPTKNKQGEDDSPPLSPTLAALIRELVAKTTIGIPTIHSQIDRVCDYIDVMDGLQMLRSYSYGGMRYEAGSFSHDELSYARLQHYIQDFGQRVVRIQKLAARSSFDAQGEMWIARLARARKDLKQAATAKETEQFMRALRIVQRALDLLLSWVSAQLSRAQGRLALPALVDALGAVQVEAEQQGYAAPITTPLEDAIKQLSTMHQDLAALVSEFNHWLQIDFSLQRVATVLERGTNTLAQLWPGIHAQAEPLYQDTEWTETLRSESKQLEQALAVDNLTDAREHFRNYRSHVKTQLPRLLKRFNDPYKILRQIDQEIVTTLRKIE
jgi:hypothetical protein